MIHTVPYPAVRGRPFTWARAPLAKCGPGGGWGWRAPGSNGGRHGSGAAPPAAAPTTAHQAAIAARRRADAATGAPAAATRRARTRVWRPPGPGPAAAVPR